MHFYLIKKRFENKVFLSKKSLQIQFVSYAIHYAVKSKVER